MRMDKQPKERKKKTQPYLSDFSFLFLLIYFKLKLLSQISYGCTDLKL